MAPIGILGGTFDPVHFGHLRTAAELLECLDLGEIRFVPCHVPPHQKTPVASADMRCAMLAAAIQDAPEFIVDERELRRAGPSYSIETLESMRAEFPERPLCLIVGMDAFAGLRSWHRWADILSFAHIIVADRPGSTAPEDDRLRELFEQRRTCDPADLAATTAGRILLHTVTQLDISSSAIREIVARGQNPRYLLPGRVLEMISSSGCYIRESRAVG